jgi:hypothetical protein
MAILLARRPHGTPVKGTLENALRDQSRPVAQSAVLGSPSSNFFTDLTRQKETELTAGDLEIDTTKRHKFYPKRAGDGRWRIFLKKN